MRQYLDRSNTILNKVVCNQCGRELKVQDGILKEGVFRGEVLWGYFSGRDGERHSFDLCEECYDRLTGGFRIPAETEEQTELL
ncbi:MAG: hypothetical protein Q4C82_07565 [Eubacteriales bacterium]|nr:hypothetical protein [Eubacteriales bacterium]